MTTAPSRAIMLFGTEETVAPAELLRAGPLTVELEGGNLRYARYRGVEALRGIAFLVRDTSWATYAPVIENLEIAQGSNEFTVTYDATCSDDVQTLRYQVTITGKSDGSLVFGAEGRAETDFVTNRAGFVVLHPAAVAGEAALVTHTDGWTEHAAFPRLISPSQPFFDIRALTHEALPGVRAVCTMEGDAYEMEDQRNWTDASYKTYIRPLAKPRPFTIAAGEVMRQSVTLAFEGVPTAAVAVDTGVTVTLGAPTGEPMPRIGLAVAPGEASDALAVVERLRALGPGFLVGQLDLRDPASAAGLPDLRGLAEALGVAVTLEIVLPNRRSPVDELAEGAAAVRDAGLDIEAVVPSPHDYLKSWQPQEQWPDVPPLEAIYDAARAAFPGPLIGGGMLSYFTELNRKRPPLDHYDFVTHTTCPIVHDCDDRAVMETLEALPWVVETVRAIAPGKPYWIGPTTIGMRQNPYGTGPVANPDGRRIAMGLEDPRQRSLLGAAWNLGYAARMAAAGVESLCLSAPVGPFGVVYASGAHRQPWFDEQGQGVYPVYHVIRGLASAAGRPCLATEISNGSAVQAVAHRTAGGIALWLANLGKQAVTVEIAGLPDRPARVTLLDEGSFVAACALEGPAATTLAGHRLDLEAYAVACIEID